MNNELKNIQDNEDDMKQEKMLTYLDGSMPDEERHEFEKNMVDDAFMTDAAEGLEEMQDKKDLSLIVYELNKDLKKQVNKKKNRKEKRKIKEQAWIYYSIILLLLLIIISYLVIKQFYN